MHTAIAQAEVPLSTRETTFLFLEIRVPHNFRWDTSSIEDTIDGGSAGAIVRDD